MFCKNVFCFYDIVIIFFFLMFRRPPGSTQSKSSAASDVYKGQEIIGAGGVGLTNVSTPLAWLGIIAYSLQLYFDFAGYSEMSNGLAALLGFDCPANFNLPYISGSITSS